MSADGVELGRAPIDPTIVDTTDEVGRAVVDVMIPANAPAGQLLLTVAVPQTGTSIGVPLTIAAVEPPAEPERTTTSGRLDRIIASTRSTVTYTVAVRAASSTPAGEVGVYDGRRLVATATLDDSGRAVVTLPKLGRGLHLISARFEGSEAFAPSAARPSLLLVW